MLSVVAGPNVFSSSIRSLNSTLFASLWSIIGTLRLFLQMQFSSLALAMFHSRDALGNYRAREERLFLFERNVAAPSQQYRYPASVALSQHQNKNNGLWVYEKR